MLKFNVRWAEFIKAPLSRINDVVMARCFRAHVLKGFPEGSSASKCSTSTQSCKVTTSSMKFLISWMWLSFNSGKGCRRDIDKVLNGRPRDLLLISSYFENRSQNGKREIKTERLLQQHFLVWTFRNGAWPIIGRNANLDAKCFMLCHKKLSLVVVIWAWCVAKTGWEAGTDRTTSRKREQRAGPLRSSGS